MNSTIIALGTFAVWLAVMAIYSFVKTFQKPPPSRDLDKDWLGN